MTPDFDTSTLARLQTIKVGELMKAIEGIDPMVRLVDVPEVHVLLGTASVEASSEKTAAGAAIAKMAALVQALGLSFSQQTEQRDLLMAELMEREASSMMQVARIMDRALKDWPELPQGTRQELVEQLIAHAAACGLFGLARAMEDLAAALSEGKVEAITTWRLSFLAQTQQPAASAV